MNDKLSQACVFYTLKIQAYDNLLFTYSFKFSSKFKNVFYLNFK